MLLGVQEELCSSCKQATRVELSGSGNQEDHFQPAGRSEIGHNGTMAPADRDLDLLEVMGRSAWKQPQKGVVDKYGNHLLHKGGLSRALGRENHSEGRRSFGGELMQESR